MIKAKLSSMRGFYVGDVWYALSEEDYREDWHRSLNAFEGVHELRNFTFAIGKTYHREGICEDQKERKYKVVKGNIGILPLELCKGKLAALAQHGTIILTKIANFGYEDGRMDIFFGNGVEIHIDTRGMKKVK